MKYPIGIQSFERIRQDGYAYVDKTQEIYQLTSKGKYYFLGRPRRFGKSLLLSTLEAYYSGHRDLFRGLYIDTVEKEWEVHPILHLDLNTANYKEPDSLDAVLHNSLTEWEKLYGAEPSETTAPLRFKGIVERAAKLTGQKTVILIDEYDKPLLQNMTNAVRQEHFRNSLKAFYSVLKTQDRYIEFALLTGVTKFSKVNVFSDLNNLNDISMDRAYATICGITEEEIDTCFKDSVEELARANGLTIEETRARLKELYDGYHFTPTSAGIYNPFSVLCTFSKQEFNNYWFETGTPTFLAEMLKNFQYRLPDLTKEQVTADVLNSIDSTSLNPVPIIYQSGYLTITGYNERFKRYRLGFPNKEVEEGFLNFLLPSYAPIEAKSEFDIIEFVNDVETGNPQQFMERLRTLFADTDYKIVGNAELYFQNVLYLIFKIMGFYIQVERPTANGRMDAIIQTADYVYIIECKLDKTADEALRQIEDNAYARPFAMDRRKLFKIGVNFSTKTRGIESYKIL
ncbi:AAA family ATPase [Prevotella multiformis]|uniref:ATP-binding protein n=1 Tax=Prevotella multiformis TaxID=282402 RepID=UPI0028DC4417|nr:AAA family ATPase [Prevotella multiformis]